MAFSVLDPVIAEDCPPSPVSEPVERHPCLRKSWAGVLWQPAPWSRSGACHASRSRAAARLLDVL